MPGYPILDIDKRNIDKEFLCESCGSLLRDATRAGCGHFFCHSCVENRFRKNPGGVSYCPKSMRPLFYYEFLPADDSFCDEVHNLTVHCLFLSEGCLWEGNLLNFEEHVGYCDFANCNEKEIENFEENGNEIDWSQTEINSKPFYSEVTTEAKSSIVVSQKKELVFEEYMYDESEDDQGQSLQASSTIADMVHCVYPECNMLIHVDDLYEHLEGNECMLKQMQKCKFCKVKVSPDLMEHHYSECPAFPVKFDKCRRDEVAQEKELNNTLPLSRKFNLSPAVNEVGIKEKIASSSKAVSAGNSDSRSVSSPGSFEVPITEQHEQRLNDLESKFDLLLQENLERRQENRYLTNVIHDVNRKVDELSRAIFCHSNHYDRFQASLNALQNDQINLQAQFNRFIENPLSHEDRARLVRHVEIIQERIRRLEQHILSHGNMLTDISTSVTSLANAVASDRIPGVDIRPV